MRNPSALLFIIFLILVVQGCDTAPGTGVDDNSAPVLSNLSFSPSSVLLDNLPPGSVQDGVASFTLRVQVDVEDEDGDLDRVFILIQPPISSQDPIASEEIAVSENGRISVDISLQIALAETGTYAVQAFASDRAGTLGNKVLGSLIIDAASEPPVIDAIDIPDRVTRPAPGEPAIQIPIVAHVSDPDGLANILRVEVSVNGSSPLFLCDDGGAGSCNDGSSSGDAVAGDGQFTLTIQLDSSNEAGDNVFVFKAIDRAGLESDTVTRTIVVE